MRTIQLLVLLTLSVVLMGVSGCSTREEKEHVEHERREVEKTETVRETPTVLPDGSIVTLTSKETVYRDLVDKGTADRELRAKTDFPLVNAVVSVGVAAVKEASGFGMAEKVGGGILTLLTAVVGAWAVSERKRGNEHKKDADQAWDRLLPPDRDPPSQPSA